MVSKKSNIKKIKETTAKHETAVKERYIEAVGRRKTAVARVRIFPVNKAGGVTVNNRNLAEYFPSKKHQEIVKSPFVKLSLEKSYQISVLVKGGGVSAQAEAVRLGISRALIVIDFSLRPQLKAFGFLKRDPRMVERKKYGLRKARRPQQWRKR